MRKKYLLLLLTIALFVPISAVSKPSLSLEEVLTKYYEAIGGLEKWRSLNTMVMQGTINSQGKVMPIIASYERPNKCRVEFQLKDAVMAQVYGGFFAWQINPLSGNPDPAPMSQGRTKYLKDTCGIESSLIDYKKKNHVVKLLGEEKIRGKNAYKISVRYRSGNIETYYIDAKTYLPLRSVGLYNIDGSEIRTTTTFTEYKDTDGYIVPYDVEIELHGSPSAEILKIDKITFNPKIDSSMFDFPKDKVIKMQNKEDVEKLQKKLQ